MSCGIHKRSLAHMWTVKNQTSLCIHAVWVRSHNVWALRNLQANSKGSDQTAWVHKLVWVFTVHISVKDILCMLRFSIMHTGNYSSRKCLYLKKFAIFVSETNITFDRLHHRQVNSWWSVSGEHIKHWQINKILGKKMVYISTCIWTSNMFMHSPDIGSDIDWRSVFVTKL